MCVCVCLFSGTILLKDVTMVQHVIDKNNARRFVIVVAQRTYSFSADSRDSAKSWSLAISNAVLRAPSDAYECEKPPPPPPPPTTGADPFDAARPVHVHLSIPVRTRGHTAKQYAATPEQLPSAYTYTHRSSRQSTLTGSLTSHSHSAAASSVGSPPLPSSAFEFSHSLAAGLSSGAKEGNGNGSTSVGCAGNVASSSEPIPSATPPLMTSALPNDTPPVTGAQDGEMMREAMRESRSTMRESRSMVRESRPLALAHVAGGTSRKNGDPYGRPGLGLLRMHSTAGDTLPSKFTLPPSAPPSEAETLRTFSGRLLRSQSVSLSHMHMHVDACMHVPVDACSLLQRRFIAALRAQRAAAETPHAFQHLALPAARSDYNIVLLLLESVLFPDKDTHDHLFDAYACGGPAVSLGSSTSSSSSSMASFHSAAAKREQSQWLLRLHHRYPSTSDTFAYANPPTDSRPRPSSMDVVTVPSSALSQSQSSTGTAHPCSTTTSVKRTFDWSGSSSSNRRCNVLFCNESRLVGEFCSLRLLAIS